MSGPRRCGSRRRPAVMGDNSNGYVETDPTGRYGRFDEVLGRGATKCVYRGFDEERGMEVAWNQSSLHDVLRTPDAVERMYSEVQLLSELRHESVVAFQASWVDVPGRTFNFVTELFSSGTLRAYRLRYPRVSLRAVRSWATQILHGLAYLHANHVIHRDLKCDNIFVNGHTGQVKIGDLGLAAVLREAGTHRARSVVGTPEFMAPEMYDEDYDERVDVYSFGMCVLEMLTLEFPYGECSNPAQIYKKVTSGKLPDAFYRVKDQDARRFIGRCLAAASKRPSAAELLLDPFLLDDPSSMSLRSLPSPADDVPSSNASDGGTLSDDRQEEPAANEPPPQPAKTEMTITSKLNAGEDTIFLKVQTTDDETGHVRNIYFPFDLASDTATEVAGEMVKELDITDRNPSEIAAMIEQEIDRLLPGREQHEYSFANDDDDENEDQPPPFCYLSSSPTSSLGSRGFSGPHGNGWSKDRHGYYYALSDDDDTSSMHSAKYSALHYVSGHEQNDDGAQKEPEEEEEEEAVGRPTSRGSSKTTTRFGPDGSSSSRSPRRADAAHLQPNNNQQRQGSVTPHAGRPRRRNDEDDHRGRMSRNRSMVDMRSQLLHRTLVQELNRRMFFNTVAAVENIGFRAPAGYGSSSSSSSSSRGRGRFDHRRRSKEDDKNQRYYML